VDEVGFQLLFVLGAIVGLDIRARAYPGGSALRDVGHLRVLMRFRGLLPREAPWATEVPFPTPGDQRAWDARTRLWGLRVGVEVEMRLVGIQALERRIALKARDGDVDRVILVVADTRHNGRVLRDMGESMRGSFPIQGRYAASLLALPADPKCNLLVLV
jgi:hypothetical protein